MYDDSSYLQLKSLLVVRYIAFESDVAIVNSGRDHLQIEYCVGWNNEYIHECILEVVHDKPSPDH